MKSGAFLAIVLLSLPVLSFAGPNAGGVLLVHANTSITYTVDNQGYCGQSGLEACSLAVTSVPWDPETTTVFFVLAAFPDTAHPRLKAISWGVEWDDSKLEILAHGSCADFDVPDGGWPASGKGIGQSFVETRTAPLAELYWFAGYAYGAESDTTSFAVIPHPVQGGAMADDAMPANEDDIVAYGRLGFGSPPASTCPDLESPNDETGGGPNVPDSPGGSGDPEEPDYANCTYSARSFRTTSTAPLVVYVDPNGDDSINLCFIQRSGSQPVQLNVAVSDLLTGASVQSFQLTLNPSGYPVDAPRVTYRGEGLAKATITPISPADAIVGLRARDVGNRDRLQVNGADLALRCSGSDVYRFWVPECATRLRLRVAVPTSPSSYFHLMNADNQMVVYYGTTGGPYEYDLSAHRRNSQWTLYILTPGWDINTPHGLLEAAFQQSGQPSGTWWIPDHALSLDGADPPLCQFAPNELVQYDDTTLYWHPRVPFEVPNDGPLPPYVQPTPEANRLVLTGRQEFTITVPSNPRTSEDSRVA